MCYGQIVDYSIHRAKKKGNPCEACNRPIEPGHEYVKHLVRAYEEGLISHWKLCKRCARIHWAGLDETGDGICYVEPRDWARERADDNRAQTKMMLRAAWERLKLATKERRERLALRRRMRKKMEVKR